MNNGLNINIKEFQKLPQKQQLALLYENTEQLKIMIQGYRFHQKVQYSWITALSGIGAWLITRVFGG